ncbi:MAG: glycosyltransferase family 9 protein [Chloroflexota bacterium]
MTDLLDPEFINLSTPIPKRSSALILWQQIRLSLLKIVGVLYPKRTTSLRQMKILLIRPDHLGDLLFLTPALRYLRSLLPAAEIYLMVGPWGEDVYRHNPHINQLIVCDFPGFTRRPKPSPWQPYQVLFQQARQLKQHQFDMAIVLRFDHWWGAWLTAAAGIPHRYGYNMPEVAPFLTNALPYNPARHEVEQNWRLIHYAWSRGSLSIVDSWSDAESMGSLEFFTNEADRAWVDQWLQDNQIVEERPLVVIHPGTGAAVKHWRVRAWATLAQRLIDDYDCQIVFSGSEDEKQLCQNIIAKMTSTPFSVAGQTNLAKLAALMGNATLAIGPDTGPLKLAAAVGTPTVELYGPVDVEKFGPWYDRSRQRVVHSALSCIACNQLDYSTAQVENHFCVRGLSVDWVLHEVVDLLQQVLSDESAS